MTHKEQILNACRGRIPDRIPWIPRLDLWYNAHKRAGDLPKPFRKASLRDITKALGVGYHGVVPNFLDVRSPEDTADRCLGIYRLKNMAFETRLHNVERTLAPEGDMTRVTYHTTKGTVTGVYGYTPEMKASGVSIPWVNEYLIKKPEDYAVLAHIYANLEVVPMYDNYRAWQDWVGDDGVAVAFGGLASSPMHHILHEVMPATEFYMEIYDHPAELAMLAESMAPWFDSIFKALCESPAEVLFVGGNFDATITYPPFFEEYILPWVARFAEMAHAKGKLVLNHTDGENEGLTSLYKKCSFDIADSFCPVPMTRMTLPQFMKELPDTTVWGGIPSVALCKESMSDRDFEAMVDRTISFARGRTHLILGIADTMPPNASWDRVLRITELVSH